MVAGSSSSPHPSTAHTSVAQYILQTHGASPHTYAGGNLNIPQAGAASGSGLGAVSRTLSASSSASSSMPPPTSPAPTFGAASRGEGEAIAHRRVNGHGQGDGSTEASAGTLSTGVGGAFYAFQAKVEPTEGTLLPASQSQSHTADAGPSNSNSNANMNWNGNGNGNVQAARATLGSTVNPELHAEDARRRGRAKGRTEEEVEVMGTVAFKLASALAQDQLAVLNPNHNALVPESTSGAVDAVDVPFADAQDAVRRLLPYHVFQQPREELREVLERPLSVLRGFGSGSVKSKGKGRATEEEAEEERKLLLLREEVIETKFALDCWRRKRALERRFRRARIAEGKHLAPDTQRYVITQLAWESERQGLSALQSEYRASKAELERVEKMKKAAAAAAAAAQRAQAQTTTHTSVMNTAKYYPPGAGGTPVTGFAAYGYGAGTSSSAPAVAATPTPLSMPMQVTSQYIPVSIPVTSLTSLASLGIVPVPPDGDGTGTEGRARPLAILRGTTQNGTMASVEIDVGGLGPGQASGLAMLFSALTSRDVSGGAGG
ncbi:hypothetical protein BDW22DRAFT_235856 [Trametopsis cervina]|nr:hypothetical protein BDW22DRAFT_235856 [Trametopsis cervina]